MQDMTKIILYTYKREGELRHLPRSKEKAKEGLEMLSRKCSAGEIRDALGYTTVSASFKTYMHGSREAKDERSATGGTIRLIESHL